MSEPYSVISWLTNTPSNDSNFINALKNATIEECRKALEIVTQDLSRGIQSKTKHLVISRALRRKEKNAIQTPSAAKSFKICFEFNGRKESIIIKAATRKEALDYPAGGFITSVREIKN